LKNNNFDSMNAAANNNNNSINGGIAMMKCHTHKCTRVVTHKNFTEGQIVERTDARGKYYL